MGIAKCRRGCVRKIRTGSALAENYISCKYRVFAEPQKNAGFLCLAVRKSFRSENKAKATSVCFARTIDPHERFSLSRLSINCLANDKSALSTSTFISPPSPA